MPKAEKQLRKDVTSLQQEVKRKRQNPGTPTDVGMWEGAESSQKREVSHQAPQYVFNFLEGITSSKILGFGFTFLKGVAISVEYIKLLFNYESLLLVSEIFKSMKRNLSNSLNLQDEITTQLNP